MANYWYLKAGGTRASTSGTAYTSLQSGGSWAATFAAGDYYATLSDIVNNTGTTFAAGDVIIVSDAHSESLTASTTFGIDVDGGGTYNTMISVDDDDIDVYAPATSAQFNSATYSLIVRQGHLYGIWFISTTINDLQTTVVQNSLNTFTNCTLENQSSGSGIYFPNTVYPHVIFRDCTFFAGNGYTACDLMGFAGNVLKMEMYNCKFTTSGTGSWSALFRSGATGVLARFYGCDFTEIADYILQGSGGAAGDDYIDIQLYDCKLSTTVAAVEETFANSGHYYAEWGCTNSSDQNPNAFYEERYESTIESQFDDSSGTGGLVVRTDGTTMSGEAAGTYMSAKVITNANCSHVYPCTFQLPVKWSALSTASTDTIRIYFCSSASLDADDVIADVYYRDGTNIEQINPVIGKNTRCNPLMNTGVSLDTDSSSTWTNSGALNKYQIDLDTSGDVASDGVPTVFITIRVPSTTIYFDTEYDLVA